MVNQDVLQGRWNELKGTIGAKWSQLTHDDLRAFSGNVDQFIGLVEQKTGETRDVIHHFLETLTSNAASSLSGIAESVGDHAQHTANDLQDKSRQAGQAVLSSYRQVERRVRQRPAESIALGLGVGICAGALLVLLLRR
jgi:uncharacterized protein YjbJ (UPF0337 family)